MKRLTRTLGLCALVGLTVGVAGTATASAAEYPLTGLPEIGRCVSSPGKTGAFRGASCVAKHKTHQGGYEWAPGPGPNATDLVSINAPVFETTGGVKIGCSFLFLKGAVADGKTAKYNELTLQGCLLIGPKMPCYSNPLEPGTIESTTPLEAELGFIPNPNNPENPWVGWDLKPESEEAAIVEFFCGESGTLASPAYRIKIEGSVIGRVKPVNKMASEMTLYYKQSGGIQNPTKFKGGVEDVLRQITTNLLNPSEPKNEQVGLAGVGPQKFGEPLEIKSKQRPA